MASNEDQDDIFEDSMNRVETDSDTAHDDQLGPQLDGEDVPARLNEGNVLQSRMVPHDSGVTGDGGTDAASSTVPAEGRHLDNNERAAHDVHVPLDIVDLPGLGDEPSTDQDLPPNANEQVPQVNVFAQGPHRPSNTNHEVLPEVVGAESQSLVSVHVVADHSGSVEVAPVVDEGSVVVDGANALHGGDRLQHFPVHHNMLNDSNEENVPSHPSESPVKIKSEKKGQKRKAIDECAVYDDCDNDDDEGSYCNICMEPWTNSGDHRIASLKCGHFFGLSCIEKWVRNGSNGCPNCNEKASKRDLRVHYITRLKAIDTSERDRAVKNLETVKCEKRQLELELTTLKVTLTMQTNEIEKLKRDLRNARLCGPSQGASNITKQGSVEPGLSFFKRIELIQAKTIDKTNPNNRDKYCRNLAYNQFHGMLVVTQPSFTSLTPGYGIRLINMFDQKVGAFLSLHREPIRDLVFNPLREDQLLTASNEKSVKLVNVSTRQILQKYSCPNEAWSCCWNGDEPHEFFVGTKRSEILIFDTRTSTNEHKKQLNFPVVQRLPIISLNYVPKDNQTSSSFPCSGLLVMTLASVWFFEFETSSQEYKAHKLPLEGMLFWSMHFNTQTRLLMISTKPNPHQRHLVCELTKLNISQNPTSPEFTCSTNVIFDQKRGGSYNSRSFLRGTLLPKPGSEEEILIAYGKGSCERDFKVIIQAVGSEKLIRDLSIQRPVLDICPIEINEYRYLAVLSEFDVILYKWR